MLNEDRISGVDYTLRYIRWFLRFLGIWPFVMTRPTRIEKNLSKIVLPLSSISLTILVIPICAHIILQHVDRVQLIILLGPIIFQVTNIIKHCLLIARSSSMKKCMEHLETDWRGIDNSNDRDIMLKHIRSGHNLTIVCAVFMYSNILSYHLILPLLSGTHKNAFNETVRPLVFPGTDIFFNPQERIVYELVFFSNVLSAFFHYTVNIVVCNLAAILVSHACGQIQITISKIKKLVDDKVETRSTIVVMNRIASVIHCHVRLLKFISRVNNALKEIFLMEVVTSTLLICLVTYDCMMDWTNREHFGMLTYVLFIAAFSLKLFLYCGIGEVLAKQCLEIGKAAYMINWYKLPGGTSLALIMIITMGNHRCKLTAGGMMELSHVNFASIMRTSFTYLNMMRKVA